MNTIAAAMRRRSRLALSMAAGIGAVMGACAASAQTSYDQGYFVTATRDDPDVGPVNNQSNNRYTYFPDPVPYFAVGTVGVSRTDPNGTYFGSAYSNAEAQAGDRFVKASSLSVLDFTTGATSGQANAIWSSRATPGADAFADISVRLDRSLYFGDFFSNADRSNQILDFATTNVPAFEQAVALSLGASIYLNVQIQELKSGDMWYATLQEDVIRQFVFAKDINGSPFVSGGIGDRSYRQLTRGSIVLTSLFSPSDASVFPSRPRKNRV